MKSIIILMLLVIANPALAEQADGPARCLNKFQSHLNNAYLNQSQPDALLLYFSEMCMPESAHSEEPQYFKLLQREYGNQQVITIQASLNTQGSLNSKRCLNLKKV